MNATNLMKFGHIFFAIVWVGGGIMLQILLARAKAAGPETMRHFTEMAEWTSTRIFVPSSFLTLGFGIATVIVGDYDWAALWINLGFAGFLVSAILGMAILGPTAKKMKGLIAERGPMDPVVTHLGRRLDRVGRLDLLILIFVVFAMVTKFG